MFSAKLLPINSAFLFMFGLALLLVPTAGRALEITPFYTFNQSPLVQIFGLPAPENARIVAPGKVEGLLAVDAASNFGVDANPREQITLDGETYRTTLALRYGAAKGVEVGLDVPYVTESGGFMDSSLEAWHEFFHISPAGRDQVSHNRLLFRYARDGVERFDIGHANGGFGDLRLTSALQLYLSVEKPGRGVALRASLKLPTGDSARLHGSGSTDFALWLSAADDYRFSSGHCTIFGAAGGMVMTKGNVLSEMRRNLAAFGTMGAGWSPREWLALKAQLTANTPFYRDSSLQELGVTSIQVVYGGTVAFSPKTSLDIGFTEDILVVAASPDFVIDLALRTRF